MNLRISHNDRRFLSGVILVLISFWLSPGKCAGAANREQETLRILTWNVWLMPQWTFQSPRNGQRAAAIAHQILRKDYDIVCLEKVFDPCARKILSRRLCQRYPFQYGPANSRFSLIPFKPVNSGVWVISRFQLNKQRELEFSKCGGIECFSRKGAMSFSGVFNGHRFNLIATHLQGEECPHPTPKNTRVRAAQLREISSALLGDETGKGSEATLICGDFCTAKRDEKTTCRFSAAYLEMLRILRAQNDDENHFTLIDDRRRNELAIDNTGRVAEEDYVLLRTRQPSIRGKRQTVIFCQPAWDGNRAHSDLSYRYALGASIVFSKRGGNK